MAVVVLQGHDSPPRCKPRTGAFVVVTCSKVLVRGEFCFHALKTSRQGFGNDLRKVNNLLTCLGSQTEVHTTKSSYNKSCVYRVVTGFFGLGCAIQTGKSDPRKWHKLIWDMGLQFSTPLRTIEGRVEVSRVTHVAVKFNRTLAVRFFIRPAKLD